MVSIYAPKIWSREVKTSIWYCHRGWKLDLAIWPETKRQSSVWIFPGENPPQKFQRSRSVGKKMVSSFFSKTGHVATFQLDDCRTVNRDWYVNHCIPQVLDAWRNKRPRTGLRGLLWHHDNASAHTAALTIDFLSENSIQLVTHPAYSPDLAPCDFFLFPTVKEKICGTKFDCCDDAICAFKEAISDLTEEQWAHCFEMWYYRMRLCMDAKGEYFEKL